MAQMTTPRRIKSEAEREALAMRNLTQAAYALMAVQPTSGGATHAQYVEIAEQFDVQMDALECRYLDLVDESADE